MAKTKLVVKTSAEFQGSVQIETGGTIATQEWALQLLQDKVYPVGAIYISAVDTNPGTLFGFGTWEQIQDKFLLSAGSSHSAGSTGGSEINTLTSSNLPKYAECNERTYHLYPNGTTSPIEIFDSIYNPEDIGSSETLNKETHYDEGIGYRRYYFKTDYLKLNSHEQTSINNMPPYLTVYVWKRTA